MLIKIVHFCLAVDYLVMIWELGKEQHPRHLAPVWPLCVAVAGSYGIGSKDSPLHIATVLPSGF